MSAETTTTSDKLRAAVEALTSDAPVYAPGTARIMSNPAENELIISVCDQHGEAAPAVRFDAFGHCRSCVFVRLHSSDLRFAQQIAALINARKPLAAWLESWDGIEIREDGPMSDDFRHTLVVARHINAIAADLIASSKASAPATLTTPTPEQESPHA
ncbi:hypothetical protein [Streptosporangium sp. CA-115845]|uniref:hypothetical protein n=1 Tax=Streptosporangium sp. CA-115845 TaxID=3240071 RepID=UPI003D92FC44